jgi:hypothetical protein
MEPEVCHIKFFSARLRVCVIACLLAGGLAAQVPFKSTGQVFAVIKNTNELHVFTVQAGYNSSTTDSGGATACWRTGCCGASAGPIVFCMVLVEATITCTGSKRSSGIPIWVRSGSTTTCVIWPATLTPDGRYLLAAGSTVLGNVVQLVRIDLTDPAFAVFR